MNELPLQFHCLTPIVIAGELPGASGSCHEQHRLYRIQFPVATLQRNARSRRDSHCLPVEILQDGGVQVSTLPGENPLSSDHRYVIEILTLRHHSKVTGSIHSRPATMKTQPRKIVFDRKRGRGVDIAGCYVMSLFVRSLV